MLSVLGGLRSILHEVVLLVSVMHRVEEVWMVTFDSQISAKKRLGHVDVFDLDLDIVILAVRLLSAFEFAAWSKERGGPTGDYLRLGEHLVLGCMDRSV